MKIHDDKSEIISKKDYSFIIRYNNTRNNQKNETLIINQYKLSIENISNTFLAITLYEIRKKLDITKYSNKLPINYFLEKSSLLRLLSLISKNTFNIQNIFNIIIKVINSEIASNSNYLIYNKKYMNFKINKLIDDDKNDIILLKFYIILANLQKEEIDIELIKKKNYINKNDNIPKIINELLRQNYNSIKEINNMESDLKILIDSKNKFSTTLKKCDAYYGQSIKMKMDFMDIGIDSDIFKSKEDYNFIAENISKRVNLKIQEIKQIFKASSNGDNINAFQESCMYVKNILVLILSDEKKCFGGFTSAEFDNNNGYKHDENAFIFSINNKEIYPILNRYKRMAINCYDDWYISVFGNDIYICDCFFSKNGNITQEGFYDYSDSKIKGDYKLTGKKYFSVSELEVYQIVFFE
jgi:hypothetical protein